MEKQDNECYDSNYNIISLEKYVENITEYTFQALKIIGKEQSIFEELRKDVLHDFRSQFYKNEGTYLDKTQKIDGFNRREPVFDYLLVDQKVLVDDLFWEDSKRSHFLLRLISLMDYSEDKFTLFKNLYLTNCSFYIKVKKTLRNIGFFPIDATDRRELKGYYADFDLQYAFLSYWISNLPQFIKD